MEQTGFGIPNEILLETLGQNPLYRGRGRNGQAPLTPSERIILARLAARDLRDAHRDHGDAFFRELWGGSLEGGWGGLRQALTGCDWLAACGWFPIWKSLLKKSMAKAGQVTGSQKPVRVREALGRALEGLSGPTREMEGAAQGPSREARRWAI